MLRRSFLKSFAILGGFFAMPGVARGALPRAAIPVPFAPEPGYRYLRLSHEVGGGFILYCGPDIPHAFDASAVTADASRAEENKAS